jgi:hypothetical protein
MVQNVQEGFEKMTGAASAGGKKPRTTRHGTIVKEMEEREPPFTKLTPFIFEEYLGMENWRDKRHDCLDFSHWDFRLEQLDILVTEPATKERPAVKDRLLVTKIRILDLSYNNLTECDKICYESGFKALEKLNLKSNKLTELNLVLPSLTDLNASWNQLTTVPIILGMPELKKLYLSQNRITGTKQDMRTLGQIPDSDEVPQLEGVDLSDNLIDWDSREWPARLAEIKDVHITTIRLKGNPFQKNFPEYQLFFVGFLDDIKTIDDLTIEEKDPIRDMAIELRAQINNDVWKEVHEQAFESRQRLAVGVNPDLEEKADQVPRAVEVRFESMIGDGVHVRFVADARQLKLEIYKDHNFEGHANLIKYEQSGLMTVHVSGDTIAGTLPAPPVRGEILQGLEKLCTYVNLDFAGYSSKFGGDPSEYPQITELIFLLQEAQREPHIADKSVKRFFDKVTEISRMKKGDYEFIFFTLKEEARKIQSQSSSKATRGGGRMNTPSGARGSHSGTPSGLTRAAATVDVDTLIPQAIANLMSLVRVQVEREEKLRMPLLRSIAKLAVIPDEGLGRSCFNVLQAGLASETLADSVVKVFKEILIQPLVANQVKDPTSDPYLSNVVRCIAHCNNRQLALALEKVVEQLVDFYTEKPEEPNCIKALTLVASEQRAGVHVAHTIAVVDEIAKFFGGNPRRDEDDYLQNFSATAHLAMQLIRVEPRHVVDHLQKQGTPQKLANIINSFTSSLQNLTAGQQRLFSNGLDLMTLMMEENNDLRMSAPDELNWVEVLCAAPRGSLQDPLTLGASLKGLALILKTEELRLTKQNTIFDALEGVVPLLDLIPPGKKFKDLFRAGEETLLEEAGMDKAEAQPPPASPSDLSNPIMHQCYVALAELVAVVSRLGNVEDQKIPGIARCVEICTEMDEAGREQIMFGLLEVPNQELKGAVVNAIRAVDMSQLGVEEQRTLVMMISRDNTPNLGSEQTDTLLETILDLLRLFSLNRKASGDDFRKIHARIAIESTFDLLDRNSQYYCYGDLHDERQRASLSLSCVRLIRACGRWPDLRILLRSKSLVSKFLVIMHNEAQRADPVAPCVPLERSWIGRSVEALLCCVNGSHQLPALSRVMLRVVARIADVLEGRAIDEDDDDAGFISIIERECHMWSVYRAGSPLDATEFGDRQMQQQAFASFSGPSRILAALDAEFKPKRVISVKHVKDRIMALQEECQYMDDDALAEQQAIATNDEMPLLEMDHSAEEDMDDTTRRLQAWHLSTVRPDLVNLGQKFQPWANLAFVPHERLDGEKRSGKPAKSRVVAAYFRALFRALRAPGSVGVHEEIMAALCNVTTMVRMGNIVFALPNYIETHVAAKCLHLYNAIIEDAPPNEADPTAVLEICLVASDFAVKMLEGVVPGLPKGEDKTAGLLPVVPEEVLVLLAQACRTLMTVAGRAHDFKALSKQKPYEGVKMTLQVLIDERTLSLLTQLLLYSLSLDVGLGHGRFISERFVRSAVARDDLYTSVTRCIARVLTVVDEWKYSCFLAISKAGVFGRKQIRASFQKELMDLCFFEKCFQKLADMVKLQFAEPLLWTVWVEITFASPGLNLPTLGKKLLGITPCRLLVIVPPPEPTDVQEKWLAWPENIAPDEPTIEGVMELRNLTRIVQGCGPQVFSLGWFSADQKCEETFHAICLKQNRRQHVIETLWANSGQSPEQRVDIMLDWCFQNVLNQRAHTEDVFCFTYAMVETRTMSKQNAFIALTESDVFIFWVDWAEWYCPPPMEDEDAAEKNPAKVAALWHVSAEDPVGFKIDTDELTSYSVPDSYAMPSDTDMAQWLLTKGADGDLVLQPPSASGETKMTRSLKRELAVNATIEEKCGNRRADGRRAMLRKNRDFFTTKDSFPLSKLSEVVFGEAESATLEVVFGGRRIDVEFFDDLGREIWRRGLAYALNKSDTASQWKRDWIA